MSLRIFKRLIFSGFNCLKSCICSVYVTREIYFCTYYVPGSFYGTIPAQPSLLYMYNILGNIYQRITPIRFKVIIIIMMSSAYTLYLYNSLELGYTANDRFPNHLKYHDEGICGQWCTVRKVWRISTVLYMTDDAEAKLYLTKSLVT